MLSDGAPGGTSEVSEREPTGQGRAVGAYNQRSWCAQVLQRKTSEPQAASAAQCFGYAKTARSDQNAGPAGDCKGGPPPLLLTYGPRTNPHYFPA